MQAFRLALSFLTIIPSGIATEVDEDAFGKSVKYFPAIGIIIGFMLAVVDYLIFPRLHGLASSAVVIISLTGITRGLHLDGLADTFDGLFGGRDRERMLEIMKDSRVGSFGVIAIVSVILLKVVLLAAVPQASRLAVIAIFPVLGRLAASYASTTQSYARSTGGLGSVFVSKSSITGLIVSSILSLAVVALVLRQPAVFIIAAAVLFVAIYLWFVKRKIGGITGDILGALIELTETVVLFVAAIV